jgi:hypothetical protein
MVAPAGIATGVVAPLIGWFAIPVIVAVVVVELAIEIVAPVGPVQSAAVSAWLVPLSVIAPSPDNIW